MMGNALSFTIICALLDIIYAENNHLRIPQHTAAQNNDYPRKLFGSFLSSILNGGSGSSSSEDYAEDEKESTLAESLTSLLINVVAIGNGEDDISYQSNTLDSCGNGTVDAASTLQVLTLNTFLIPCMPMVPCQEEHIREERVKEIGIWFQNRTEDIVLMQELWSFHNEIRDGMTSAGYCHHIMAEETYGSGLAIFSKYPIVQKRYAGWFEAFGIENVEAAGKGVMYAEVVKGVQHFHLFNLHANSDSFGDNHLIRMVQFKSVREMIDMMQIPSNEVVVLGGDFNEDKDCSMRTCDGDERAKCTPTDTYYKEMVEILSVDTPATTGNHTFTYDTERNDLLKDLYNGTDSCDYHQYTLDYIFFSENHMTPSDSSLCEVLRPVTSDGTDLSDHLPVVCTFEFNKDEVEEVDYNLYDLSMKEKENIEQMTSLLQQSAEKVTPLVQVIDFDEPL